MEKLAVRIESRRIELGLSKTDVWKGAGVSSGAYSHWMNGGALKGETLIKVSKILKISPAWLETGKGAKHPNQSGKNIIEIDDDSEFFAIKRVDLKISAGISGYAVEYLNGERSPIFFRRDWIEKNGYDADQLHAIAVKGESMETSLHGGDLVVINTADTKHLDGEVYAINYEGELVIKRMHREAGEWFLSSDNPNKRRFPNKICHEETLIIGRIIYKQSEKI